MAAAPKPIRRTLMTVLLLTSGVVMLTTAAAFCAYEVLTFRQQTVQNLATLAEAVAANSTAALAFENPTDAGETLSALRAEHHIVTAALYTRSAALFASYTTIAHRTPPPLAPTDGYRFEGGYLIAVAPVVQGDRRMGSLYIQLELGALNERLRSFGLITVLVLGFSCIVAYLLARRLQQQISQPILQLAQTASAISSRRDYTLRAARAGGYELSVLTESFNDMVGEVGTAQTRLQNQLARLNLLHRITHAIGERQDLSSIFQVVLHNLEKDLPVDFGCLCLYDATLDARSISVAAMGEGSCKYAEALGIPEQSTVPIGANGLSRCVAGHLVYEPDVSVVTAPLPQRFAGCDLHSLVFAPLLVEKRVFGVLIVARRQREAFSSGECEFLRHLSDQVALASNQAQLHTDLQRAYDELRQSQQTILQQERLRALGQMASGIAHDINNAISPIALYTESLLEREPQLSQRARGYLVTIQRAIEDVAETVARMREFYRPRGSDLNLSRVGLNRLVEQVVELTRARWSDLALQKGTVIQASTELAPDLPDIMGAEAEIRDALTNLIFNAVDAMPEGGRLILRTGTAYSLADMDSNSAPHVYAEVVDFGSGMDEETRRRCMEPFFTTKGERGTGLGLAMVYGMVQRHSAEVTVDSSIGHGTTVRVSFMPAQVARAAQSAAAAVPGSLRLLLVDDDPLITKSLRDILDGDGHSVVVADGGQNGIDEFVAACGTSRAFAVVITDLGMPHVDGRKVAAAVKNASPETPVIMLTGWGRRLVADNEVPVHVDRILSKPPKMNELRAVLAELTRTADRSGQPSSVLGGTSL